MNAAELARIRARHSDIPQDALPGMPEPEPPSKTRRRYVRPLRFIERCPHCLAEKVAVIDGGHGTEIIRPHYKRLKAGLVPCPASNQLAPQT